MKTNTHGLRKSLIKAHKEEAEKKALRQRVRDIATGAAGYQFDTESEFATAEFLSRFIIALRETFLCKEDGKDNSYLFQPHCLNYYETIDSTTAFLWEHNIRA